MDYKDCFILMPFTKTDTLSKDDLDYIYTHIIKKAVEEFELEGGVKYYQLVERFSGKIGSIISGIVSQLNSADLVIADLTGLNHNVMYELGVRHSLKRGTIIISQNLSKLPSDLKDYLTVEYNYSSDTKLQAKNFEVFKVELHKTIMEVLTTKKDDSPVLAYLQQRQRFQDEEVIIRFKSNVASFIVGVYEHARINGIVKAITEGGYKDNDELIVFQALGLHLNNFLTAINDIQVQDSSKMIQANMYVKSLVSEVTKLFAINDWLGGLKELENTAKYFSGLGNLEEALKKKFVNPFHLLDKYEIVHCSFQELFEPNGIIQREFITLQTEYLEKKAAELGLAEKELQEMIDSHISFLKIPTS